jgi:cysteine-rich repeat protein
MKAFYATALACVIAGCDMFDPALYQEAQSLEVSSDACIESAVPLLQPSAGLVPMALDGMSDNWQVQNCGTAAAIGNDAFFAVDLEVGRKLHVHVNALDAVDPVVYIVDSCDERVCQPLNAASRCPGGKEHLSFVAPRTDRYFVGVDSLDPGGGLVEVLAITPQCGDGAKEHGEACEDGNTARGDGCDAACRNEIGASDRVELEPNDDLTSGNVLVSLGEVTSFRVRGTLEGPCDPEVFSFEVPRQTNLVVGLFSAEGDGCAAPGAVAVELVLYQGFVEIARAVSDAQGCVGLPVKPLQARVESGALPEAASTYHVQVRSLITDEPTPLGYTLSFELL